MRLAPRTLLRLEGLALFLFAVFFYRELQQGWLMFALLFLVPDLSMLGYLANPRAGALLYNAFHTYVGPVVLILGATTIGVSQGWPLENVFVAGSIWLAHIGLDRALGYGLKHDTGFGDTHLGKVGRAK